jgi:cytochrome b involved in lipid metabolism
VYDVTDFAPAHPGGIAILAYGGRDASDVFAAFHASSTWSKLKQYCIGVVEVRSHPVLWHSTTLIIFIDMDYGPGLVILG